MLIEAPVIIILEAKKGDLKPGLGQCIAEMVAAQRFNQTNQNQGIIGRFRHCMGPLVMERFGAF